MVILGKNHKYVNSRSFPLNFEYLKNHSGYDFRDFSYGISILSQNEKFRKSYLVLIPGYFFIHDLEIHPSL